MVKSVVNSFLILGPLTYLVLIPSVRAVPPTVIVLIQVRKLQSNRNRLYQATRLRLLTLFRAMTKIIVSWVTQRIEPSRWTRLNTSRYLTGDRSTLFR